MADFGAATGRDVAGLVEGGEAGERALDKEAAVGLLRRSATLLLNVDFLAGGGTSGALLRDRARDAAVGAYSPEDGVFGRVTGVGVLARC